MNQDNQRRRDGDRMPFLWLLEHVPPRWRALVLLVLIFGPLGAISVIATGKDLGYIRSPTTEILTIVKGIEKTQDDAIREMKERVKDSRANDMAVIRLLWATCRNVARNPVETATCDSYWKEK